MAISGYGAYPLIRKVGAYSGGGTMIKFMCPDCKDENVKCEIVSVVASERRYEIRCPICGKIFVVYGKDTEGQAS